MNAKKLMEAVIVAAMSAALAVPSVAVGAPAMGTNRAPVKAAAAPTPAAKPAAAPVAAAKPSPAPAAKAKATPAADSSVVDVKQVEAAIIAAQGQIVAGNLDAGLKAIQDIRAKAVTADLAARVAFVAKLAEGRMAEKVGDQAKFLAALTEAFAQAKQPDQVQATWAVGLAVAQATVAGKGNAAPVIDFLAKGPGPAMKQFATQMEMARLRMATANVGAAEAELRNGADCDAVSHIKTSGLWWGTRSVPRGSP